MVVYYYASTMKLNKFTLVLCNESRSMIAVIQSERPRNNKGNEQSGEHIPVCTIHVELSLLSTLKPQLAPKDTSYTPSA